jgi:hypothetical protein
MRICSARIGLQPAWFLFILLTVSYLQIFSSIVLAVTSFNVINLTAGNSVTAGYTRFSFIQLNDAGQAAFSGVNPSITDSQGRPRTDVFFWDGSTLKNITANIPGFVVFSGSSKGDPTYASRYKLNLADIRSSALHDCLLAVEDRRFYRLPVSPSSLTADGAQLLSE